MYSDAASAVETVYRTDWGRIVATLIRLLGDFDLAEECAQEAFTAAADQWPVSGIPEMPRAWIVETARHKGIDRIRRRELLRKKLALYADSGLVRHVEQPDYDDAEIPDDRLRLIFTCCHPALTSEAQVALTLRTLCGLETDEIARAFLVAPATMAQRLVRAKRKIRDAGIPYIVPGASDMEERIEAVLTVLYLVFNEGYSATRGERLVRTDLCAEAIRLGRLIMTLMGAQAPGEVLGLVALMLLHDSRRDARIGETGELVLLADQDRARWDREEIAEALPLVEQAMRASPGAFAIQSAIAAEHCRVARPADTDWAEILRLYDELARIQPSAVVSLNRAVALAMVSGPKHALTQVDALASDSDLNGYHLLHAVRADLLRRLGLGEQAAQSYRLALALVTNVTERRFLEGRLLEVQRPGHGTSGG